MAGFGVGFVWVVVVGYRCGFGWGCWFLYVGWFFCLCYLIFCVFGFADGCGVGFVFGFCCYYVIVGFGFVGLVVMF